MQEDNIFASATEGQIADPCATCGVRCCNRFAVPITGFDLVRILEKKQTLDYSQICELADAKNIESAPHSLVFIYNDKKLEEKLLTLIRKKNMYCIFSKHSRGCDAWGAHPYVCKAYPFCIKDKKITYVKNFACPRKWQNNEYDESAIRKIVQKQNDEIEQYNKIVREWNAKFSTTRDQQHFFEYLIFESRKIIQKEQQKNYDFFSRK